MDMPRADGLSSYLIVTGRDPPMGNISSVTSRQCVAATPFIERQRYIEENFDQVLRRIQLQLQREVNLGQVSRTPLKPGDRVWVRSPTTALGLAGDRDEFDVQCMDRVWSRDSRVKRRTKSRWMSVWEAARTAKLSRSVFCHLTRMTYSLESLYPGITSNQSAVGLMTSMKMTHPPAFQSALLERGTEPQAVLGQVEALWYITELMKPWSSFLTEECP